MTKSTFILISHARELAVDVVVEPLSKTIHLRVEWIDTQLFTELLQDRLLALVNELLETEGEGRLNSLNDDGYKIWLHTINRGVEIGNNRAEAMIEICEAIFTVELREDTLIIKPMERPRYA